MVPRPSHHRFGGPQVAEYERDFGRVWGKVRPFPSPCCLLRTPPPLICAAAAAAARHFANAGANRVDDLLIVVRILVQPSWDLPAQKVRSPNVRRAPTAKSLHELSCSAVTRRLGTQGSLYAVGVQHADLAAQLGQPALATL